MNRTLIGIRGDMGAGKDTLAAEICRLHAEFTIRKFASPLREAVHIITDLPVCQMVSDADKKVSLTYLRWPIGQFEYRIARAIRMVTGDSTKNVGVGSGAEFDDSASESSDGDSYDAEEEVVIMKAAEKIREKLTDEIVNENETAEGHEQRRMAVARLRDRSTSSAWVPLRWVAFKAGMTLGKLLQLLGTECFREVIGQNVWVDATMVPWKKQGRPPIILADTRFPNESAAIRDAAGVVIKIVRTQANREDGRSARHASERALDGEEADFTIENNGTVAELAESFQSLWPDIVELITSRRWTAPDAYSTSEHAIAYDRHE
jgi:transposase InsO family protein